MQLPPFALPTMLTLFPKQCFRSSPKKYKSVFNFTSWSNIYHFHLSTSLLWFPDYIHLWSLLSGVYVTQSPHICPDREVNSFVLYKSEKPQAPKP